MGKGLLVCGLNGAGKSTLAKALAERLNLQFIDIEDIYFSKQDNPDYPYEKSRPYEEVVSLSDRSRHRELILMEQVCGRHFPELVLTFVRANPLRSTSGCFPLLWSG